MLLDHLYLRFPDMFPLWFHPVSRFVAPLFAYLAVEGFIHTRSRMHYIVRLLVASAVMFLGNTGVGLLLGPGVNPVDNNIFLTLGLGVAMLNLVVYGLNEGNTLSNRTAALGGAVLLLGAGGLYTEGGIMVLPFMLVTYLLRHDRRTMFISYAILSIILLLITYTPYSSFKETLEILMLNSDFLFILVIPFILQYNGGRGPRSFGSKYLFYLFYPLHLWILAGIDAVIH